MSETSEAKKGNSGFVAVTLLTVIAVVAGGTHGFLTFKSAPVLHQVGSEIPQPIDAASTTANKTTNTSHGAASSPPEGKVKLPSKIVTRDLPPLITNIQLPPDMWVRVEGTLVYDQADIDAPEVLASDITSDLLGFLRTLTLRELQGADGLMFLRQDLKERIFLRSDRKVRDFVIQALVVQ